MTFTLIAINAAGFAEPDPFGRKSLCRTTGRREWGRLFRRHGWRYAASIRWIIPLPLARLSEPKPQILIERTVMLYSLTSETCFGSRRTWRRISRLAIDFVGRRIELGAAELRVHESAAWILVTEPLLQLGQRKLAGEVGADRMLEAMGVAKVHR